jgi:hypothetical protein
MQLVCQLNSLNRRDVTDQQIAEPSEILTVQENIRRSPHCQSRVQMPRTTGKAWQRPYVFERACSSSNSLNKTHARTKSGLGSRAVSGCAYRTVRKHWRCLPLLFFGSLRMEVCLVPLSASTPGQYWNQWTTRCLEDRGMLWHM